MGPEYEEPVPKNLIEEILEQIIKADEQALLKEIKTNAVILNEDLDFSKAFLYRESRYINPMILGKHIFVGKLPEGYSFALAEVDLSKCETELQYYKRRSEELEKKLEEIKEVLNIGS